MQSILRVVAAFVIGLGALGFGGYTLTSSDVKCGEEIMVQGDVCQELKDGVLQAARSYDEQKSENSNRAYITLGVGVLALAFGAWSTRSLMKARKQAQAAPAPETPATTA